jgi:hypothetical protein
MTELTLEEVEDVSGGDSIAEACLAVGGAAGFVGAFFGPAGAAIGGLGGCVLGVIAYKL